MIVVDGSGTIASELSSDIPNQHDDTIVITKKKKKKGAHAWRLKIKIF